MSHPHRKHRFLGLLVSFACEHGHALGEDCPSGPLFPAAWRKLSSHTNVFPFLGISAPSPCPHSLTLRHLLLLLPKSIFENIKQSQWQRFLRTSPCPVFGEQKARWTFTLNIYSSLTSVFTQVAPHAFITTSSCSVSFGFLFFCGFFFFYIFLAHYFSKQMHTHTHIYKYVISTCLRADIILKKKGEKT